MKDENFNLKIFALKAQKLDALCIVSKYKILMTINLFYFSFQVNNSWTFGKDSENIKPVVYQAQHNLLIIGKKTLNWIFTTFCSNCHGFYETWITMQIKRCPFKILKFKTMKIQQIPSMEQFSNSS